MRSFLLEESSSLLEESSKIGHCLRHSSNDHIGVSKLLNVLVVLEWNLESSLSNEQPLWLISEELANVLQQRLHHRHQHQFGRDSNWWISAITNVWTTYPECRDLKGHWMRGRVSFLHRLMGRGICPIMTGILTRSEWIGWIEQLSESDSKPREPRC